MSAPESDPNRVVIGDVPKSKSAVVRVSLSEFEGHRLVDLRVMENREDGTAVFTKKGCTIRIDRIEHLIRLLQKARDAASSKGWLSDPPAKAA